MTATSPGQVVGLFYERFDSGDLDSLLSLFGADLETSDPGMGTVYGIEPFREYIATLKRAVPDAQAVVEQTFEASDAVIVEGRFVGTFSGPLATPEGEVPPTGARVDLRFADVSRVNDGKIVSYRTYYDQLALLTHLGLMGD